MGRNLIIFFLFLLNILNLYAGPVSEYYVVDWYQEGLKVIQGNSVIRSWTNAGTDELAIVVDGLVRTFPYNTAGKYGAEYDLNGNPSGTTYSNDGRSGWGLHDGTTDGTYYYAFGWYTQKVYRFNTDWSNPQEMFASTAGEMLGITYDPSDNTLWLSGYRNAKIAHYKMDGTLLETFSIADSRTGALALDHADQTLWYYAYDSKELHQYSRSGALLEKMSATGLGSDFWGGEFDYSLTSNIPEPYSCLLLLLGMVAFFVKKLSK